MRAAQGGLPNNTARLWLLGALALVLLPHLLRLPALLAAYCMVLMGWGLLREWRQWPLPGSRLRVLITLLSVVTVGATYHTLFGREAGITLLTVMVCLKLLELGSQRDAMLTAFLGYFLLVAHFLYGQSILTGVYALAAVGALTAALTAMNHAGGTARRYLTVTAGLMLQALPIMALLFVLFPRIPGPLWGMPQDAFSGRTGLSENMSPGSISSLADSHEVAFRVQFHTPPPEPDALYWRGPVLWITDGRMWDGLQTRQQGRALRGHEALGRHAEYTVTLEPHDRHWLFALDLPAAVPQGAKITQDYQLLADAKVDRITRYRLISYTEYVTGPLSPDLRGLALGLPTGANPRTRELGERWRREEMGDRQIVERALELFRTQPYYYTRHPPLLGEDAVDAFLFESRRGFCEHYAAAFTTLMRAAGVPARVVTGYQGGEQNPVGNYLVVRQSDAHAWSEVWLEEWGWWRVDPTAVIPPHRVEASADRLRFQTTDVVDGEAHWLGRARQALLQRWDALDQAWNQWVVAYDPQRQQTLLQNLGFKAGEWKDVLIVLFSLVGLTLLLVTAYLIRGNRQATDPVQAAYDRFCRKMARAGLPRSAHEGPADYAARVLEARPDLASRVTLISRLYSTLRYGRHSPVDWLDRLRRHVRALRP